MTRRSLRLLFGATLFAMWVGWPLAAWADTCEERARSIAQGTIAIDAPESDCTHAGVLQAIATVTVATSVVSVAAATLGISLSAGGGLAALRLGGAPAPAVGASARPAPASEGARDTTAHADAGARPAGGHETLGEPPPAAMPSSEVLSHLPSDEIRHAVLSLFSPGKVVGWKFHDIEHFREEYWKAKALENPWEVHQTQDHVVFTFSSEFGVSESAARSLLELPKAMWEAVATVISSVAH